MKHRIENDVNVNLNVTIEHDVPTQDLDGLIDKVVDGAVTIIVVFTAAQIVKAAVTK